MRSGLRHRPERALVVALTAASVMHLGMIAVALATAHGRVEVPRLMSDREPCLFGGSYAIEPLGELVPYVPLFEEPIEESVGASPLASVPAIVDDHALSRLRMAYHPPVVEGGCEVDDVVTMITHRWRTVAYCIKPVALSTRARRGTLTLGWAPGSGVRAEGLGSWDEAIAPCVERLASGWPRTFGVDDCRVRVTLEVEVVPAGE